MNDTFLQNIYRNNDIVQISRKTRLFSLLKASGASLIIFDFSIIIYICKAILLGIIFLETSIDARFEKTSVL